MDVVELIEHGKERSIALGDAAGRALASVDMVEARPDPKVAGQWLVKAGRVVGTATVPVPGGDAVTLRIAPKLPIARLLFLLGYAKKQEGWQSEHVQVDEDKDLLPVVARLFALLADEALRHGLLKGYRGIEETAVVMRGRIREAEQVRTHHGMVVPLEVAHDEYTPDITENRILRSACDKLLRLSGELPRDVRGSLLRLRGRLIDMTPLDRAGESWRPSRLNIRYQPVLRLADIVLREGSVENRSGDVTVHGFLFDMAQVFEDFVTKALADALRGSGRCRTQVTLHLDEDQAISMRPDFVRYGDDGSPLAVVDAKYKTDTPKPDLYQMLAYCTALNLKEGFLIYAKGHERQGSHRVRHAGITIHQHALELDQPAAGLREDIRILAQRLAKPL